VAFYRVSTEHQGESGLGLQALQDAVSRFLGTRSLLAELANLDRLTRNFHFISGLIETGVSIPIKEVCTLT
jgi:hypothetical protein